MQRNRVVLLSLAGLALAGGIWALALVGRETAPPIPEPDPGLAAEVAELREALRRERDSHREIADQLARLRADLVRLEAEPPELSAPLPEVSAAPAEPRRPAAPSAPQGWFDAAGLAEHGVSPAEIARLREIHAEHQLERLYLRDLATREGWAGGPEAQQERLALESSLREELGEEDYDWLLYATHKPNRVVVVDVLEGSPAESAGLLPGDVIVRYDDGALFQPNELVEATSAGRAGSTVPVDVLREGARRRFFVPRGPLGVRTRPAHMAPERPR